MTQFINFQKGVNAKCEPEEVFIVDDDTSSSVEIIQQNNADKLPAKSKVEEDVKPTTPAKSESKKRKSSSESPQPKGL